MFTTPIWKALQSQGSSQAKSLHIKELRAPHPPKEIWSAKAYSSV